MQSPISGSSGGPREIIANMAGMLPVVGPGLRLLISKSAPNPEQAPALTPSSQRSAIDQLKKDWHALPGQLKQIPSEFKKLPSDFKQAKQEFATAFKNCLSHIKDGIGIKSEKNISTPNQPSVRPRESSNATTVDIIASQRRSSFLSGPSLSPSTKPTLADVIHDLDEELSSRSRQSSTSSQIDAKLESILQEIVKEEPPKEPAKSVSSEAPLPAEEGEDAFASLMKAMQKDTPSEASSVLSEESEQALQDLDDLLKNDEVDTKKTPPPAEENEGNTASLVDAITISSDDTSSVSSKQEIEDLFDSIIEPKVSSPAEQAKTETPNSPIASKKTAHRKKAMQRTPAAGKYKPTQAPITKIELPKSEIASQKAELTQTVMQRTPAARKHKPTEAQIAEKEVLDKQTALAKEEAGKDLPDTLINSELKSMLEKDLLSIDEFKELAEQLKDFKFNKEKPNQNDIKDAIKNNILSNSNNLETKNKWRQLHFELYTSTLPKPPGPPPEVT